LLGHITVKVSTQNGAINPGDMVAYSPTTGIAGKATKAGIALGRAIDGYSSPNQTGKILVYVSPMWYDPDVYMTSSGDLNIFAKDAQPAEGQTFGLKDAQGLEISRIAAFSEGAIGMLKAGAIDTQKLTLAGENVSDKFGQMASASATLANRVDSLESRVSSLEITGASGSGSLALADLTARVATLEGQIASQSGSSQVTLGAFDNLDLKVASLESSLSFQASQSAFFMDMLVNNPLLSFNASSGAELGLDKLDVKEATVSGILNVLGDTTLTNVGITGTVNAGLLAINGLNDDGFAEINTIAGPLKLQSHGLFGLDILDGKVTIASNGDMHVDGEVTVKKLNIDTTNVAAASAGLEIIPAGTTTVDVDTTALTSNSLIFVTPDNAVAVGAKKKDADTFTIKLPAAQATVTKVNWFIIN
jgi:hypothetical protein